MNLRSSYKSPWMGHGFPVATWWDDSALPESWWQEDTVSRVRWDNLPKNHPGFTLRHYVHLIIDKSSNIAFFIPTIRVCTWDILTLTSDISQVTFESWCQNIRVVSFKPHDWWFQISVLLRWIATSNLKHKLDNLYMKL